MHGNIVQIQGEIGNAAANVPTAIDEAGLATLDSIASSKGFDTELLSTAPAMDMRRRIEALLVAVNGVNPGSMMRKQGWFSTLTGADIEARLEFELASQDVVASGRDLAAASSQGRKALQLLANGKAEIATEQERLAVAIAAAKSLLARDRETSEQFLLSRFERRVANMEAMHAANTLTIAQIHIAVDLLKSLIDRCTDTQTVILPLWQRQVVALLHAMDSARRKSAFEAFTEIHTNLVKFLKGETVNVR